MGKSTLYFANYCPNAVVYAVDLWSNQYLLEDPHYIQSGENLAILKGKPIYEQFIVNTWEKRCIGVDEAREPMKGIVPIRMDSCDAMQLLHDNSVSPDIIYVDANHHYPGAYRDIATAVKLFPHAHIIGDDWDYEGVRKAVQAVARENKLDIHVQSSKCWTFSKAITQAKLKIKDEHMRKEAEISSKQEKHTKNLKSMSFAETLEYYRESRK